MTGIVRTGKAITSEVLIIDVKIVWLDEISKIVAQIIGSF
jgi:hypothetical protein